MSNIVRKELISDGPSKAMLSVYLESDGVEGELTNYVLLDPIVDFAPGVTEQLSILQVWYSFSWFDALLKFDDLLPYPSWNLSRDSNGYFDLRYFGGIKDRAGIDHTGKLLVSTKDFAPLESIGTMVIELRKN